MIWFSEYFGRTLCECYECGESITIPTGSDPAKILAANDWIEVQNEDEEPRHYCPRCVGVEV